MIGREVGFVGLKVKLPEAIKLSEPFWRQIWLRASLFGDGIFKRVYVGQQTIDLNSFNALRLRFRHCIPQSRSESRVVHLPAPYPSESKLDSRQS